MRSLIILAFAALAAGMVLCARPAQSQEDVDAAMLRFPAVSAERIAFVYDNDVWTVDKRGGTALPLSSPAGLEVFPRFSPDGKTIAFSGNYDGNNDVYTIPVEGGTPTRLTYHPYGDNVVGWSPDGRVIFSSFSDAQFSGGSKLFFADMDGGMPTALPVKYAGFGSLSADGQQLAFTPWQRDGATWKRYQGGMATDIWLFNMKSFASERITTHPGTDTQPMFSGSKVYYLSDAGRENRLNIWVYDTVAKTHAQVTNYSAFDVKWPSIGPAEIVYENGGQLYLLSLADHKAAPVRVHVPGDHPNVRASLVDVSAEMQSASVSPSGKRIAAQMRGDVWTIPAEQGFARNLTRTDGIAEREPSWSPDGKWVAYFSDRSGEYELTLRSADGKGEERQLTSGGKAWRFAPNWSPDSRKIAFHDKSGSYYIHIIDSGETVFVDKDPWGGWWYGVDWAADSNWITYTISSAENSNGVVRIYDLAGRRAHSVTSDMFSCSSPSFDRSGDYLYYTTNMVYDPVFGELDETFVFSNSSSLTVTTLRKDIASPWAPKNDEEEVKEEPAAEEEKKDEAGEDAAESEASEAGAEAAGDKPAEGEAAAADEEKKEEVKPWVIDVDGLGARAEQFPLPGGNYYNLVGGTKQLFYIRAPRSGSGGGAPELLQYSFGDKPEEVKLLDGVDGFQLTADGGKLMVVAQGGLFITGAAPGAALDKRVPVQGLLAEIDPREEWKQLIWDTWRIYRDFFYDPGMHGVDWDAQRDRAVSLLPYASNRQDVSYIIGEMISELNVGHAYLWSAPTEAAASVSVGLLGADFKLVSQDSASAYRIEKIYAGADWEIDVRGPLSQPGLDVKEGDFVLAVNGIPIDTDKAIWAAFQNLADKPTSITVSDKPLLDDSARDVLVVPTSSDYELRLRDWIESNRQRVYKESGGKVGYVYVRNTGMEGLIDLQRQFIGQHNMQGLIIDERWNGGGMIPHRFIELLNRPVFNYWAIRDGKSWRTPGMNHPGPKVMLINHAAGSGGDAFPHYFRKAGLGKLIGTRTWGGLVGISGNPGLIDGSYNTVPTFGIYEPDGTWAIEGHGVDPDIVVVDDPSALARGEDPQLAKAIEVINEEVRLKPWSDTPTPAYPDRSGAGIPDDEK